MTVSDAVVKHMVNRFLGWRLPKPWNPDNGISYTRPNYAHFDAGHDWPSGTNLFDAMQAEAMVRYMMEGMPRADGGQEGGAVVSDARMADRARFVRWMSLSAEQQEIALAALAAPSPDEQPKGPSDARAKCLSCDRFMQEGAEPVCVDCRTDPQNNSLPGPQHSCLCCGYVGEKKVYAADRPEFYVCTKCHAKANSSEPPADRATTGARVEPVAYTHPEDLDTLHNPMECGRGYMWRAKPKGGIALYAASPEGTRAGVGGEGDAADSVEAVVREMEADSRVSVHAWAARLKGIDRGTLVAFDVKYGNGFNELQWANAEGSRDDYTEMDDRWGTPKAIIPLYAKRARAPVSRSGDAAPPYSMDALKAFTTSALREELDSRSGDAGGEGGV